ncbi:MAG: hypothetical protein ACM3SO_05530 [Betaproteobacteria bacterium]
MPFRALLAAAVLAAALPAFATPQQRNATDMWFNAAESGWGLNIIHQGDTLFGSLFVYGPDGQPKWYVASNLSGDGVYSGQLFECAGPYFGAGSFNPSTVGCRPVGTMTLNVGDANGTLDYTVDGVHVTKSVTRFTFRPTDLTGLHRAYIFQPAAAGAPEMRRELERFSIVDSGTSVAIDSSSDSETDCSWSAAHGQEGQFEVPSGTSVCTSGFRSGSFSMRVDPTPSGFVGSYSGPGVTSSLGRIAAALAGPQKLEGTGWRNGMWFVPSEFGWGLNVIEQGDTIFATLFVYDPQGKPRWYVASDLTRSGTTSDGTAVNSGPLYEATGPYFGAPSFDPSAVNRRQVGTMSFQVRTPGTASLTYTVDGVSVTKTVTNFAFRRNDPSGTYIGQITGNNGHDPADITIDDRGGSFSMRIKGMFGGSTCDYTGSSQQLGHVINASGSVQCGAGAGTATFVLRNLTVAFNGITGRVELGNVTGFVQEGLQEFQMAGARTTAN